MNGPARRREPRGPERTYRERGAHRDACPKPAYSLGPVGAPMPRSAHCGPFDGGKFAEPRAVPPELAPETLPRLGARCVGTAHHATFGCAPFLSGSATKGMNGTKIVRTHTRAPGKVDMTGDANTARRWPRPRRPRPGLFGFAEGYLDATDGLGDQVVDHRADRAHRGYQDDVQRAEHAGVAQDPGRGEPSRDVRARRTLA
jgi:hypothetical protein